MIDFIRLIISLVPGSLSSFAQWVSDRISSVFNDGVRFAGWIKQGVRYMEVRALRAAVGLRDFAVELALTIYWLAKSFIPKQISYAVTVLRTFLLSTLGKAVAALNKLVDTVVRQVFRAINAVSSFLSNVYQWARRQIISITDAISRIIDRLFGVLGTPQRLAEWAISAIWTAALRLLYAQRDKIARWLLRSSGAFTVWLARELESILRRII